MRFVKTRKNAWTLRGFNDTEYGIEYDAVNNCYWTVPYDLEFSTFGLALVYWRDYDAAYSMAYELMENGIKCADGFGNIRHLWTDWEEIAFIYCNNGELAKQFAKFTGCMVDIYKADSCLRECEYGYDSALFHVKGGRINELNNGLAEFICNMLK